MPLTFLLSPSSIIPNPTFFGTMRGHNPTGTMIVVYWHSYALFTGRHYYCLPMTQRYTTQRSALCVDPTNQPYYPSLVGGESVATEAIARPTQIMIFELTTFFRERSNGLRGLVANHPPPTHQFSPLYPLPSTYKAKLRSTHIHGLHFQQQAAQQQRSLSI